MTNNSDTALCNVFVYGTLKPHESNYAAYCAGKAIAQQQAIAYGELFALPMGYPAMISGHSPVKGYLLSFPDTSILESLDELEDYQSTRPDSENLYNRYEIEVFDLERNSLGLAWAYFMTLEKVITFGGIAQLDGYWSGIYSCFK
ncbi:gamma-glutamylcyclotransferase family protein [Pseudanabaena yagii]|uniref:Gamma-glutamylcyclotransferase n=1 Tax=Pseudanabaena yagii GIHE-NHR1 TaxID=2722753 RepID=A0ABX1LRX9_9CYAN|nr:gamma-glutamylcyclotransferase [Pseudanabaena yagii]NMF57825.1 gamma-glutamylcyclotransferase [Pseudanabaena yagii GIHE-NHR1]